MKHRSPKVLYFSLNQSHIKDFWDWVNGNKFQYSENAIFSKANASTVFVHAADLPLFLNQYDGNLQSLHVIIDYASIPTKKEYEDIIRDMIIEFPEVQFLFDKSHAKQLSLSTFLFSDKELENYIRSYKEEEKSKLRESWKIISDSIVYSLLELYLNDPNEDNEPSILFSRIINGLDNTFDASNLRYAIKYWKCLQLKVDQINFIKTQDSRLKNLAICIEEETRQNMVNSYSLYANGYRVFPITTREELRIVNEWKFKDGEKGIIIRDFDLQFEDEDQVPVDKIRGFRYCEQDDFKSEIFKAQVGKFKDSYTVGWNDLRKTYNGDDNNYWKELTKLSFPQYFVSKGPKHSRIISPEIKSNIEIIEDNKLLLLPGLTKPVCGLYSPFQGLPEVKDTYNKTRFSRSDINYEIITSRKGRDHSTPLDIYYMANNMIRRAESYYEDKRYLLAALVAGEALEFLNGFHHRLMVKAYYIQAIAENAIAMDVIGGNEEHLAKDAMFRVNRIIEDVDRFYYGYPVQIKWNVLNHIFISCRLFCKEHEHFPSEAIFLSYIGHLNEGYEISDIYNELKEKKDAIKNELNSFFRIFKNWKNSKK